MTTVAVELDDAVAESLSQVAIARGLNSQDLLKAAALEITRHEDEEFATQLQWVIEEYRPVLRRLGE